MNRSLDSQRETYMKRLMQYGKGDSFSRPESTADSYLKSMRYGSVVQGVPLVLVKMGYLVRSGKASSTRFHVVKEWPKSEEAKAALVQQVIEACNPHKVCIHPESLLPTCDRRFFHGHHDDCAGWPLPGNPLAEVPTFVLGAELERRGKITPGAVADEDCEWRLVSTGPGDADWQKVRVR